MEQAPILSHLRVEAEREVCHCAGVQLLQRIRQHTSAYVSLRQHTSAYVSIRQYTSAYVLLFMRSAITTICEVCHCAGVQLLQRIRQHTSAYVSLRQYTSAFVSIRQYTSAYVSIRQYTSAYVLLFVRSSSAPACAWCSALSSSICTYVLVKQVNQLPA